MPRSIDVVIDMSYPHTQKFALFPVGTLSLCCRDYDPLSMSPKAARTLTGVRDSSACHGPCLPCRTCKKRGCCCCFAQPPVHNISSGTCRLQSSQDTQKPTMTQCGTHSFSFRSRTLNGSMCATLPCLPLRSETGASLLQNG